MGCTAYVDSILLQRTQYASLIKSVCYCIYTNLPCITNAMVDKFDIYGCQERTEDSASGYLHLSDFHPITW